MFPLALAALLAVGAGDRPPVTRPHPIARPRPPPKPAPPPEPAADPDEADTDSPDEAPPGPATSPAEPEHSGDLDVDKITDEQAGALVLVGGCCCFLFVAALGVLVYFLVRKKPAAAPAAAPSPYAAAPPPTPAPFHLSVLAVGLSSVAREAVAQQLLLGGVSTAPATAAERAHLVRELAKALRLSETHWSHFGYGERLDLFDEAAAARSYQLAVDDFKKRSDAGSLSGESSYVVATLVLCTRRQLRGVSSLDDRAQIRTMLEDRSALQEGELMGAFLVWSPPLGGSEVLTRFPEMHALR